MSRSRPGVCPIVIIVSMMAAACGEPPEKEMQQAQGAIDAARAVGADEYAHDEFVAAQDALKHAREAVDQRDYRLALNHAIDSRERAQDAAKTAADRRGAARATAERAIGTAAAALADARLKLKTAESARIAPAKIAGPRAALRATRGDHPRVPLRAAVGRGRDQRGARSGSRRQRRSDAAFPNEDAHLVRRVDLGKFDVGAFGKHLMPLEGRAELQEPLVGRQLPT